jgi:penicillin-binding protein 2
MFGLHDNAPALRRRLRLSATIGALCLAVIFVRLWMLQVLYGDEMRTLSEDNRIRLRRTEGTRGLIIDRFGRTLVDSRPSFDAVLVPEDAPDLPSTVELIAQFLKQSAAQTQTLLAQASGRPPFQEITVKRDLEWEDIVAVETHQLDLAGVSLRVTPRRSYLLGPVLGHTLGYVGEASKEEVERDPRYRAGDLVGKSGLEKQWEEQLRGAMGGQQVEVDAVGRELRVLHEVDAQPGNTLRLTLDLDLQTAAEESLGDRVGSVVAIDPQTGEVLALVNRPSFDPNAFVHGIQGTEWRALLDHPRHPLNSRATQGQYPPGSTFKIVMAAAALEEGVINPFTRIHCNGSFQFGNKRFRCWKKGGHGSMNVHDALVNSCDVFFYQVGQRLGIETIAQYARAFGLGLPTGVTLEHEKGGIVPDPAWKQKRFKQPWYAGETVSVSIGQGYVTATPMQMAQLIAATSTGVLRRPHLVKRVESATGEVIEEVHPEDRSNLPLRKTTLLQVQAALTDVVAGGTGKNARLPNISVAGKTGTSQVVTLGEKRVKANELPWQQRDHAWFVAYAPTENPQIAVATLVEHAEGGGGAVAAPVTRGVLSAFFHLQEERAPKRYAQN